MKAELFRALGHPMRVRMLERLAAGGISAHLATLRKEALVVARRDGTSVIYRVKDARILQLLDRARQMLSARLQDTQMLLRDLDGPATTRSAP
jgi:ArsR family transcriptional regulator